MKMSGTQFVFVPQNEKRASTSVEALPYCYCLPLAWRRRLHWCPDVAGLGSWGHRPMIRNRAEVRLFAALRSLLLEDAAAVASVLARFQSRHFFSYEIWQEKPRNQEQPLGSKT